MNPSYSLDNIRTFAKDLDYGVTINKFTGDYIYVNNSFCEICEYSVEELMNMGFKDVTHKDDVQKNVELDNQLLRGDIPFFQMAKRYVTKSDKVKNVLLQVSLIRDDNGEPIYYYAQVVDVTDLSHLLEQQSSWGSPPLPDAKMTSLNDNRFDIYNIVHLYRSQNLDKAKQLSYIVHELKNPLNGVLGMGNILYEMGKAGHTDKFDEYYQNFTKSGKLLSQLINHILDLTCIDTGNEQVNKSEFDLLRLTKEVLASLTQMSEMHNIPMQFDNSNDVSLIIHSDKDKVWAIIVNLVSNALKYTESGYVEVKVSKIDGDKIQIQVKDTGIGIKEEDLSKIFDEFAKVHHWLNKSVDSTGLGLAITKRQVSLLGGNIGVQSTLEQGSTFTVTLPVCI